MSELLANRVAQLAAASDANPLAGGRRGIEKESLRVTPQGFVAQTPHPDALGSALTHRYITTDYSEALLEFVTPPEPDAWAAMQFMCDVHQFVYGELGDELLWPLSMPCRLRSESDIPIAQYGSSNVGRMKSIYRNGLGHRYGRYMQVIAGIHFNYSVPDSFWESWAEIRGAGSDLQTLKSDSYMGAVRNVRRLDWLLLYLFGASPAICPSFLAGADADLDKLDDHTWYGKYATSLRMSDLGYQNSNQSALYVSPNSLTEYVNDLAGAIVTPNEEYARLGVRDGDEYLQLNVNQLQIENEYYSTIRPKRVARSGERPTAALLRGGVEYIELRALDISPFDPAGMGQQQQRFLEAFLVYALLADSPPIAAAEHAAARDNHAAIARRGRQPGLQLTRDNRTLKMQEWALEICDGMAPVCEMLDGMAGGPCSLSLDAQRAAILDSELTPSARLLDELASSGQSFADYGLGLAGDYRDYFLQLDTEFNAHAAMLRKETSASRARQQEIERADELSLDEYLRQYYE